MIQLKLYQKLMIDYLTNINFRKLNKYQIYQELKYARNFIKAEKIEEYTTTQKAIEEAIAEKLQELPDWPDQIPEEIREILPFDLLIQRRSQTTAIVNTLRIIYTFGHLSETYFRELPKLPENPYNLLEESGYVFPIRSRCQLP